MCDQNHFDEDVKKYSRRDLGVMVSAGLGAAFLLPRSAHAVEVAENDVEIKTPDGVCDAYFVTPKSGAHAAVLVWPDIFGLRPAFRQMGKRLAESGYSVLVVNPFYRTKKSPVAKDASSTPIQEVFPLARTLSEKTHNDDAKALKRHAKDAVQLLLAFHEAFRVAEKEPWRKSPYWWSPRTWH